MVYRRYMSIARGSSFEVKYCPTC